MSKLDGGGKIVFTLLKVALYKEDLERLRLFRNLPVSSKGNNELLYLNDNIIEVVSQMVMARNLYLFELNGGSKATWDVTGVFVYPPHFYAMLFKGTYSHDRVKTWTRKGKRLMNIFLRRRVFFPIHQKAIKHWSLVYGDMQKKKMIFYDPYHHRHDEYLDGIKKYLGDEYRAIYKTEWDMSGWTFEYQCPSEWAKQGDSYNCGMFVVLAIMLLSEGLDPVFAPTKAEEWRGKLLKIIFEGRLPFKTHLMQDLLEYNPDGL